VDEQEKVARENVANSLSSVVDAYADGGPHIAQRHAAASNEAQKEYLRYILGGSAGGIAILTSQFHELNVSAQASSSVAIAIFALSLRYSLLAIDALWKEYELNGAQHLEWWRSMLLGITNFQSGGDPVKWRDLPVDDFTNFTRWSRLARATLIGGACSAFFTLILSVQWDQPLWISDFQHRLAHFWGSI
jgi:hypothetical protein